MKTFLCELKVNGCKSINKQIDIKFCNSTIKKNVDFSDSNIKAIYGPNGSGKSAIVTAMYIYDRLIWDKNSLNDSYFSDFIKEVINKETNKLELEVTVLLCQKENNEYYATFRHSIIIKNINDNIWIASEKLSRLKGYSITDDSFKTLVEIVDGKILCINDVKDITKSQIYLNTLNLLNKHSIININFDYNDNDKENSKELITAISALRIFGFNLFVSIEKEDLHYNYLNRKQLYHLIMTHNQDSKIPSGLKIEDDIFSLSVEDRDIIEKENMDNYENKIIKLTNFIKVFKPNLDYIEIDKKINNDKYYCSKIFHYGNSAVNIEFESTGIKKLVRIFNALLFCTNGRVVFIDELDANLHDVYFSKLIEFLKDYSTGQLCFTTHNLSPIEILEDNKHSLDFLSNDSRLASWIKNGNKSAIKQYIYGLIDYSPFNVNAIDFINSLLEK